MDLKWDFDNADGGKRLTIHLGVDGDEAPELKDVSVFLWSYNGTTLDGEALQPIEITSLETERKLSKSWVSSKPHMHGLYVIHNNRVVHHRDITPKIG